MVVKVWVQASSFGGGVYKEERSKPLMDIMGVSVTRGDESKVSKISNVSYASTEIIVGRWQSLARETWQEIR